MRTLPSGLFVTQRVAQLVGLLVALFATVAAAAPAQRIVALAPSGAALVIAAGAGSRLVGVSSYSPLPAALGSIAIVASPGRIDHERIALLKPDLVIAWRSGNPPRALERLAATGVTILMTEPRRLTDLSDYVRQIGQAAGTEAIATAAADDFERELRALARPLSHRVFVEIWHAPIMTVNGAHLISDVLRHCGAANVFAHASVVTPRIGIEALIAAQPDVIITSADLRVASATAQWRARRKHISAVASARIIQIEAAQLHQQSLGVIGAVRLVCNGLAGEAVVAQVVSSATLSSRFPNLTTGR